MTTFQKIYPGFTFLDQYDTNDTITIVKNCGDHTYYYTADQSYEDENGNWIEQTHDGYLTESELRVKLRAKHICWSDNEE